MLAVGPQSAGAEPGPVCYGKGGTEPTVSDANLVLGYFPQKALLGGQLPLDREAAAKAIKDKIADPLGISLEKAAHGIYTIVNNNMVNGIRRVSVERGFDPRDFILVGAGGATAAHITSLAREMDSSQFVSNCTVFGATLSVCPSTKMGLESIASVLASLRSSPWRGSSPPPSTAIWPILPQPPSSTPRFREVGHRPWWPRPSWISFSIVASDAGSARRRRPWRPTQDHPVDDDRRVRRRIIP